MDGILPYYREYNSTKHRYDIIDRRTGEVVNDTETTFDEASKMVEELNAESRAGLPPIIEVPTGFTKNRTPQEVGAPSVHK